jgi:hypothetical protein
MFEFLILGLNKQQWGLISLFFGAALLLIEFIEFGWRKSFWKAIANNAFSKARFVISLAALYSCAVYLFLYFPIER